MTKADVAPSLAQLERTLGVRFSDRTLLQRALIHRSYLNEVEDHELESYERLEYLGDAFLGWVIAHELYQRHPDFDEGELTRARASLVQGQTLAEIADALGLGEALLLGQGEEQSGGRRRPSNLAAAVEAVLGAVLLDRGERAASRLVLRWLGDRLDALDGAGVPRDPKSALQEALQQRGLPLPSYEVLDESGPPHSRRYRVRVLVNGEPSGEGEGRRKVDAEKDAATMALATLRKESPSAAEA